MLEINSHSLFSKWFSESGKLVQRLFNNITELVDEDDAFLDDTAGPDDDRAGNGEDSRLGMNYGPCADSDVALEFDILADNGF